MPFLSNLIANPELPALFADSVIGLYLDQAAPEVFGHGRVTHLAPGTGLPTEGRQRLNVVLDGRLAGPSGWYGPGNHMQGDQAGFLAVDMPARIWTLDLGATEWLAPGNRPLRLALTRALIAADSSEAAATPPQVLPDPTTLCDVDHPEIRRRAARLRRTTPAATAEAIMLFVHPMPYRFGYWQERASDTLARGVGMCTTKANLQVALMRAAGLEAGFGEGPMPMTVIGKLMPEAWRALQRPMVRHFFAAVRLGGRWHAADCSYDDATYGVHQRHFPESAALRRPVLAEGLPYAPALCAAGLGPWDFEVVPHLAEVMGKSSRFRPHHFEALNTRLDHARGAQRTRIVTAEPGDGEARA